MNGRARYRRILIDCEGMSSPSAMRAWRTYDYFGDFRQRSAAEFYRELAARYLQRRQFRVGVYNLKFKRAIPDIDLTYLDAVLAFLFMHNDEHREFRIHGNTWGAVRKGGGSNARAFFCDGRLFVCEE